MTKAELLVDLERKEFVDRVISVVEVEDKSKVKWYQANVFQVYENSAVCANVDFYVTDEGTKEEKAYYKDSLPESKVQAELATKTKSIEEPIK